jgi:hypothetical protein
MDKSIRPKARPEIEDLSTQTKKGFGLVPNTRSKSREQELSRGDVEFRSDLQEQLWYNPLARLGYDPTKVKTMPQDLGASAFYFPPDNSREGITQYFSKVDPTGVNSARVNPDDTVFFRGTSQSPIVAHELTHRGVSQVLEYYKEDPKFFEEKYGEMAALKLKHLTEDSNEGLTELFDDLDAVISPIRRGRKDPVTSMSDTRTDSFESSQKEFQDTIAKVKPEDRWSHQELRYSAATGIMKAAEDLLKLKGEPPKTDPDYPNFLERLVGKRFAEGGLAENTMEQQMNKLFAEGGINTGNAEIDPVSGNEVPPGSMPEEVRDDIDAKLSGGEYVVPADVLRFYGVSFFEKLRKKAKDGLAEMNSDGRIGGGSTPEKEEEDDFPFSMEELESEDEVEMAVGGLMNSKPKEEAVTTPKATASFNPNDWAFGETSFGSGASTNQMKQYLDKNGNIVNVLFVNGKPIVDVEALGYTEYTGETQPKATGEAVQSTDVSADNRDRLSDRVDPENSPAGESGPPSWTKDVDWAKMSPEEAIKLGSSRMTNSFLERGLMGVAAMANPMLGLGAAGIVNASNIKDVKNSIASLTAAGNNAAAEALQKSFDASLAEKGPAWGWLSGVIEGKPFGSIATTPPTTTATTTPGTIPSAPRPSVATPTTSGSSGRSSVTPSGSISASSYNREGSGSGSDWGSTTAAKDSKETVSQAQERAGSVAKGETQAAGATTQSRQIDSEAYSGMGYTQGRATGGLVTKPKPKAKKPAPRRKTKI